MALPSSRTCSPTTRFRAERVSSPCLRTAYRHTCHKVLRLLSAGRAFERKDVSDEALTQPVAGQLTDDLGTTRQTGKSQPFMQIAVGGLERD